MAVFIVEKISIPFDHSNKRHPVSVGFGANRTQPADATVWLLGIVQPPDDLTSTVPVALQMSEPPTTVDLPIHVSGSCVFPKEWRVLGNIYKLVGTGPGGVTILSSGTAVPSSTNEVLVEEFGMTAPQAGTVPFKSTGDWKWLIMCLDAAGGPAQGTVPISSSESTRLELYFTLGPANDLFEKSHVVELLRRTFLSYDDFQSTDTSIMKLQRILSHIVSNVWETANATFYDCRKNGAGGKAKYKFGSNFHLATWLGRNTAADMGLCNCEDLAGVVDIYCKSLATIVGSDGLKANVIPSYRTSADWYGYITTGPTYGWKDHESQKCNSPFWKGAIQADNSPWFFEDTMDKARTSFGNHTWTEIDLLDGTTHVIDICHGVLGGSPNIHNGVQLAQGDISRADYIKLAVNVGYQTYQDIVIGPEIIKLGGPQVNSREKSAKMQIQQLEGM